MCYTSMRRSWACAGALALVCVGASRESEQRRRQVLEESKSELPLVLLAGAAARAGSTEMLRTERRPSSSFFDSEKRSLSTASTRKTMAST